MYLNKKQHNPSRPHNLHNMIFSWEEISQTKLPISVSCPSFFFLHNTTQNMIFSVWL